MTKKIKLAEAARDLKIENQEIIDLMEKYDGTKRKNTTSLSAEELNYILEHYSQNNQVNDFNAYFESKNKPIEEKPAEEVKKPAVKKEKPKKEKAAKKTEPNNETPKAKKEIKPAESKKEAVSVPKTEKSAEKKITEKSDAEKKADKFKRPEKPVQNKKQAKQQPKPQKHGEKQKIGTAMSMTVETTTESNRRTVDTRGSYVNLDKYNERYEQIAPANKHKDNYSSKKQKINQKSAQRNKNKFSSKRETEAEKLRRLELERARKQQLKVLIPDEITVGELAARLKATATDVIKKLMGLGVMATINEVIDFDTAALVADEMGAKVEKEVIVTIEERLIDDSEDDNANTEERSPVVVVMGHVDHGKTSLLDRIRHANVTASEAGGITQHIGAYNVKLEDGRRITFLDTPGHEAFTAMRARGAQMTDIAIIIVAADDNVMPQTVEAINHASAAGVPIVFAINKIDKPNANPDKIKEELANMNYLVEDWGGKYQSQEISAKKGTGVHELMEKVLLEAELLDLKANPNRRATGSIIESTLDKGRGYVATVLVQNGTLHKGDVVLAGTNHGKVKAMFNERNARIEVAGPSAPVQILGLNGAPQAGDVFHVMDTEQEAREIANKREQLQRELGLRTHKLLTLDDIGRRIAVGNFQELNLVVKGDVDGSVEALSDSLIKLSTPEIQINVLHKAVGQISESDITLAAASNAIIIGFQVRPSVAARRLAEKEGVDIRLYSIIYDAIEEVKSAMEGMLSPEIKEEILGTAEVLETYHITKVGTVAGCIVKEGKLKRSSKIRLIRDGIVIYSGDLGSLKRFKDDVKEVTTGFECGLNITNYNDVKIGDLVEAYEEVEVKKTL